MNLLPTSFQEAIDWAKNRGVILPDEFYGALAENSQNGAFTVSGLASLSQIQTVFDSLNESIAAGETFEDWQQRAGSAIGELTDAHTETIFRNFMQQGYNAGRWEQFDRNIENRPYLLFSAVNDARTTQICRHRNGIIRRVDDPFWRSNSPQLHHNCRSTLISLTAEQAHARSRNDTGINQPEPIDRADTGWGYKMTGEDVAAGLATAIAQSAKNAPAGWLSAILSFFSIGWTSLLAWLGRLL